MIYNLLQNRLQNYCFFFTYANYFVFCKLFLSFAAEIGGDFTPCFGVPFVNRSRPSVVVEPLFGFAQREKEILVAGIPFQFGLCVSFSKPCECCPAVGIESPGELVLFQVCQAEYQRKELADVVCAALKRTSMENFCSGISNHSAKLHNTRVSATRGIYRKGRKNRGFVLCLLSFVRYPFLLSYDVFLRTVGESLFGIGAGSETFVFRSRCAFHLCFAVFPVVVNTGCFTAPHDVVCRSFFTHK